MADKRWIIYLDAGATVRQRVRFVTEHGRVEQFAVQLEVLRTGENGDDPQWTPVIRYDGVHGFAYCDRLRRDGEQRKEDLGLNFADALTYAISDVQAHWRQYVARYDEGEFP